MLNLYSIPVRWVMLALVAVGFLVTTFAIAGNPLGNPGENQVAQEPAERLEAAKGVSAYLNFSAPY